MKKVFVYGGCVSRDIFNSDYNKGGLRLADYVARYSIAKLSSPSVEIEIDKTKITSAFQQRLLINDSKNKLLDRIESVDFDYFLMDLMFVKYRIVEYKKTWLTYSSELKRARVIKSNSIMLGYADDGYWEKLKEGLDLLFNHLYSINKINNVIVNKLFLASKDDQGNLLLNQDMIHGFNAFLDKLYLFMKHYLKAKQFISYDESLFVAKRDHRWGLDPMHYIDTFYEASYDQIVNHLI